MHEERFTAFLRKGCLLFIITAAMAISLPAGGAFAASDDPEQVKVGEVGDVPVVFGNPEPERKPIPELDTSGLDTGPAPLTEPRPETQRPERPNRIESAPILTVSVEGNSQIVSDHILSVVSSKPGAPMDQNRLARDADEIFELGFFSSVDYRVEDEIGGSNVIFIVTENPDISEINFHGNTVYTEDTLRELCFTKPGMIFNRVFFRNDLQRIKEKYQQDGYVMARVADVKIDGTAVNVYLTEPKIGEIIIQGNRRTKTYVIQRQLRIKEGDQFNATRLRYTLSRLQGMGYFDDVNVGFEQGAESDLVNVVLTVSEAKTGRLGVSVGYGSQSGLSGGLSYNDSNWQGRGERFGIGFDIGRREQYWITLEQPYMDEKVFAWRVGAYKRAWEELSYYEKNVYQFDYDEDRIGAYFGFGRKFAERSKLSWYLTAEWQKVDIDTLYGAIPTPQQQEEMESGKNFSVLGRLTRDNMDPYLPYPKGDVESISVEKGFTGIGDWSYWKYWIEARYYTPLNFFTELFERNFTIDETPPIIAARIIAGTSDGYLPWAVDYTAGGDSTIRGYKEKHFRGDRLFIGNAEFRLPVHKNATLVLFYDIGRAWDTRRDEKFDLGDMSDAYGLGVRLHTPLGNLRFDVAQGDDESRVHFGFGEMF